MGHSVGSVGKVEFVSSSQKYTGLFQGASYGIVRISLAKEPSESGMNTAPWGSSSSEMVLSQDPWLPCTAWMVRSHGMCLLTTGVTTCLEQLVQRSRLWPPSLPRLHLTYIR